MTTSSSTETNSDEESSTTATAVARSGPDSSPRLRRRGLLAAAGATLASLAGCSLLASGDQQSPTNSPTRTATASPTPTPTDTDTSIRTPTSTETETVAPSIDEQFAIASDALRTAVKELRSMNLIRLDVSNEMAYRYPDQYYGVKAEQVVQTNPEDVVAFNPDVVSTEVARAKQAVGEAESLAEMPKDDLRQRIEVYRRTITMIESAGKAYGAMRASAMLFWDGLKKYQTGEYEAAYLTLIKADNAIDGEENDDVSIPDPESFVRTFYETMDELTTSDLPDGYNVDDRSMWDLHWALRASSAVDVIISEWGRVFFGVRRVAMMLHRYTEMKQAYANDNWDRVQFHARSFDGTPGGLQSAFADDPELRTPNVLDGYDAPGLCIGQDTEEPVAKLNEAASRTRGDLLKDAMERFEAAIENCPSFPEPPANR